MEMKRKCRCVTVNVLLCRFFYSYAFYINRYRWLFLIVPIIFAAVATSGFYFLQKQTRNESEYIFTPYYSQASYERAVLNEHWPLIPDRYIPGKYYKLKYRAEIVIQAQDDGSMLRPEYLNATIEFNRYLLNNFSVLSYDGLENITYRRICLNWEGDCYENSHLELLREALSPDLNEYIQLTYPVTRKRDAPLYLGSVLGGVKLESINGTEGRFDFVHSLRVIYSMVDSPHPMDVYSRQWMIGLEDVIKDYQSPYIKFGLDHQESLDQGLAQNAGKLIPKFAISFAVLCVFCVVCSLVLLEDDTGEDGKRHWALVTLRRLCSIDWVRSKPGLAVLGLICAGMAICSAMGIMLLIGVEFNSVIAVMPFLVLSIGVNDMCIMSTGWHRTSMSAPVEERLAEMLSDAAVAITITSVTDVVSFAIGAWNSLPAVVMFCSYTSVALLMEYLFQITFFTAAFAFYGHAEARGLHNVAICTKAIPHDKKDLNFFQKIFFRGTVLPKSPENAKSHSHSTPARSVYQDQVEKETPIMRFFRTKYTPAILDPVGRVMVVLGYAIYMGFAFWGCTRIHEGLQFSNLVYREHYVMRYIEMIPDFWDHGFQVQVIVSNPPNFADQSEREKLLDMVHHFENTPHTMGSNATMFFLNEYMNYLNDLNVLLENTTEIWYMELKQWIKHTGANWEADLRWDPNNETNLLAFRFQIGLRDFSSGDNHRATATVLRHICSQYHQYNISTYQEYWPFVDQYISIRPNLIQDNVTAVICMIIIAAVLIPNVFCTVFITLSMLSINIGVYGFMTWWHCNLDCVSMITLIMALGFAIDYSAHICYAYVSAEGMPTSKRTAVALETLGWPVFQGAMCTIIGTTALASVDGYIIQTFFKTVFLSILFGLLHSVVFLPVALSMLLPEEGIRILEPTKALLWKLNVRLEEKESQKNGDVTKTIKTVA